MRIRVRNPARRTVPNVAVTVETKGAKAGDGVTAFGQKADDSRLADPNRPIWILDQEPVGGTSAYANTWSLGPLKAGADQDLRVEADRGRARRATRSPTASPPASTARPASPPAPRPAAPSPSRVADEPVPARVNSKGEVVRGEEAGAGKD